MMPGRTIKVSVLHYDNCDIQLQQLRALNSRDDDVLNFQFEHHLLDTIHRNSLMERDLEPESELCLLADVCGAIPVSSLKAAPDAHDSIVDHILSFALCVFHNIYDSVLSSGLDEPYAIHGDSFRSSEPQGKVTLSLFKFFMAWGNDYAG